MKITQEIPKEQIEVLRRALTNELSRLDPIGGDDQNVGYEIFDIKTLLGLLKSKVVVELTKDEYDNFTANNGIDFPIYIDGDGLISPIVIDDKVVKLEKVKKFARKCDITGEVMNEGYVIQDGEMYIKHERDLIVYLRSFEGNEDLSDELLKEEAYDNDVYYWTEWSVEHEDEYYDEKGNLFSVDK
jgi:hypothetical protein